MFLQQMLLGTAVSSPYIKLELLEEIYRRSTIK